MRGLNNAEIKPWINEEGVLIRRKMRDTQQQRVYDAVITKSALVLREDRRNV